MKKLTSFNIKSSFVLYSDEIFHSRNPGVQTFEAKGGGVGAFFCSVCGGFLVCFVGGFFVLSSSWAPSFSFGF